MDAARQFGLVRLGTLTLALPVEALEAVVRGPLELTDFPCAPLHVLGAFAWRGRALPAVDLAAVLQPARATAAAPTAYAVVLRAADGRFAVAIDEMLGLVAAPPATITSLDEPSPAGLFRELYTSPETQRVAVVLDLEAVLRLADVRRSLDPVDSANSSRADAATTQSFVRFRVGPHHFALDSGLVRSVLPAPSRLDSPLHNPVLHGFHSIRGGQLPVVDLLALLGFAPAPASPRPLLLILEHADRTVGFPIEALASIDPVPADRLQPADPQGWPRPETLAGHYIDREGGAVAVLAPDALLEFGQLVSIADDAHSTADTATSDGEAARQFLIYHVNDRALATDLLELEAVIELPSALRSQTGAGPALVGLADYRGQPLKILDLAQLLAGPPTPLRPGAPVLVARTTEGCVGYLVDRVELLHTGVAAPVPGHFRGPSGVVAAFSHMLPVRTAALALTAAVLSLRDLAATPAEPAALSA